MHIVVGAGTAGQPRSGRGAQPAEAVRANVAGSLVRLAPAGWDRAGVCARVAPCRARRHPGGHLEATPRVGPDEVPEGFRTGEVWTRYRPETPHEEAPATPAGWGRGR